LGLLDGACPSRIPDSGDETVGLGTSPVVGLTDAERTVSNPDLELARATLSDGNGESTERKQRPGNDCERLKSWHYSHNKTDLC
jgi:hypothetical protein